MPERFTATPLAPTYEHKALFAEFQKVQRAIPFGSLSLSVRSVSAAYTATRQDHTILCDATGGAFSVTLPKASTCTGLVLRIKRMNAGGNAVTIDGNGSEEIDGNGTQSLAAQYDSYTIQSTGSAWVIL